MKKLLLLTTPLLLAANTITYDCNFNSRMLAKELIEGKRILELGIKGQMEQSYRMQKYYAERVMVTCPVDSNSYILGKTVLTNMGEIK